MKQEKNKNKKHEIIITILGLLMFNLSFAQSNEQYRELVKEAWALYESKNYLASGEKYSEAFVVAGNWGLVYDRYNAACSWSLANKIDSSFVQLIKIAKNGSYSDLGHISTDGDLKILHSDKRWEEIIQLVKQNKEEAEKDLDKPLVAILDSIYLDDQVYRKQIGEIEEKYGRNSKELQSHWAIIHEKDSINLIKVKNILDERGWLGTDVVGRQGNTTLFLVVQHADLKTQLKYLPMMREAVKEGNAKASNLALLEDRVALRQGKKQIYGSQLGTDPETGEYFVSPLIDPDNVDKRREEVGLGTMSSYLNYFGMKWDVNRHKERSQKLEAEKEK